MAKIHRTTEGISDELIERLNESVEMGIAPAKGCKLCKYDYGRDQKSGFACEKAVEKPDLVEPRYYHTQAFTFNGVRREVSYGTCAGFKWLFPELEQAYNAVMHSAAFDAWMDVDDGR